MVHVLVGKFQLRQGKLGSGEKCITRLFDSDPSAIMSKIWGFKRSVFVSVDAHGENGSLNSYTVSCVPKSFISIFWIFNRQISENGRTEKD